MEEVIVMQIAVWGTGAHGKQILKMGLSVFMAYSEISCFLKHGL